MGEIIIAGKRIPLEPGIKVTTFLDFGGMSFYRQVTPTFESEVFVDETTGESGPYVRPRRPPPDFPAAVGLGGAGWDAGGLSAIEVLRRVIRTVVLHHDGAVSSRGCFETLKQRHFSTHFMIDFDGHIYQVTDVADMAQHAGGVNQVSVGIDLNNPAPILPPEGPVEIKDTQGRPISEAVEINGRPYRSLGYTEEQYRALVALLRVLLEQLAIEPVFPVDENGKILNRVLMEPPPAQFSGIQCHWHSSPEKWDPGPGFDWERVLAELRAEDAEVPAIPLGFYQSLDPASRSRFPKEAIQDQEAIRGFVKQALSSEETGFPMLQAICKAIEENAGGGYYPMGINQTWHNGIHIPVKEGTMIRPMLKGELVAAHLVPEEFFPPYGSNNFVVLRHRIVLPPRGGEEGEAKEGKQNILTVFSLYMHLAGVDLSKVPEGAKGLLGKIKSRENTLGGERPPPIDPRNEITLRIVPKADQVEALKMGYVGLFSPLDKPEAKIELGPRDELWFAGRFGPQGEAQPVLHLEVFADSTYAEAMELSLYGKYLEPGPDEPESSDLIVRSESLLSLFDPSRKFKKPIEVEKVLKSDDIQDFFTSQANLEQRIFLRRLIVRHCSEWSDQVDWVKTLFGAQSWEDWRRRLEDPDEVRWLFTDEVRSYLRYIWLTEEVARHIGARWEGGVFTFFHPINFLAWWLYRRSAVRGKPLEEILKELEGSDFTLGRDITAPLEEVMDLPSYGEWQL